MVDPGEPDAKERRRRPRPLDEHRRLPIAGGMLHREPNFAMHCAETQCRILRRAPGQHLKEMVGKEPVSKLWSFPRQLVVGAGREDRARLSDGKLLQ